ncbi:MAG: AtpZ/AtpI family protein, partial [Alphaproteobacteria bacterium]|nr:AtpZ/AtpI family protein [Alphaproteobacteria bacterium]
IGWFLDDWLDTRPWLLIVFLFLGIGAGLSNAFRLARKYSDEVVRRERIKGGSPPLEDEQEDQEDS